MALVVAALLSGCVAMPNEGPVEVRPDTGTSTPAAGAFYEPRPPVEGAGPRQIVLGFLEAMRATPIKTAVAAEFLSRRARETWTPERATVTYRDFSSPSGERTVRVDLVDAQRYDARGAWTGALDADASQMEFAMVREDGQWRIDAVPDGLVVPASWFEDWFERALLYFLGPGGEVLVPEPVYVPSGDQLAASLVRGLLAGPGEQLDGVVTSALPDGLGLALNSVPIDDQGVADVVLEGRAPDASDDVLDDALAAQLAWTLRQEPRIRRFRVVVNGQPLRVRSGGREVAVDTGRAFSPVGANATTDVFALRDGRLVRGAVGSLEPTTGPFGTADEGLRSVGVDPSGGWAVGVSADGNRLLRAPVTGSGDVNVLLAGATDLLPPVHDEAGRVWTLDRAPGGARVLVADEKAPVEVRVPGVTGTQVRDLLVSRDGTRLAAVVRGATRDRLVLSRLVHSGPGGVRGRPAREIDVPGDGRLRITDVSWWTPDALAVLSDVSDVLAQMQVVPVDGAPDDTLGSGAVSRIRGDATRLVTSPVDGASPYVEVDGRLRHLLDPTQGIVELPSGVTWVTHAG